MDLDSRSVLYFRKSCFYCRNLSYMALVISLGAIRRIPINSTEALELQRRYPITRGKIALINDKKVYTGTGVLLGVTCVLAKRLLNKLNIY